MVPASALAEKCRPRARRANRGTAAVEFCLAIAFILTPIFLMIDCSKMGRAYSRAHVVTRQQAWSAARNRADGGTGSPYADDAAAVVESLNSIELIVKKALPIGPGDTSAPTGDDSTTFQWFTGSVLGHVTGFIVTTRKDNTSRVSGLLALHAKQFDSRSIVAFDSDRELDWSERQGWFDPLGWINALIRSVFTDPKSLVPSAGDVAGMLADLLVPGFPSGWMPDIIDGPLQDVADLGSW
jgi:Flp pilus assembly protein TadG